MISLLALLNVLDADAFILSFDSESLPVLSKDIVIEDSAKTSLLQFLVSPKISPSGPVRVPFAPFALPLEPEDSKTLNFTTESEGNPFPIPAYWKYTLGVFISISSNLRK